VFAIESLRRRKSSLAPDKAQERGSECDSMPTASSRYAPLTNAVRPARCRRARGAGNGLLNSESRARRNALA
jgi:hypothetical protein